MAQEILITFSDELKEVTLRTATGGTFTVSVENEIVFDRKEQGRFPEIKELKQLIRDKIAPDKSLGHSDIKL